MALLPFAGAFAAAFLSRYAKNAAVGIACLVALVGIACAITLYPAVNAGIVRHDIEWLPSLGLNIVLRLDGLSWAFTMLILTIGLLVVIYARYYISPEDPVARFFSFLLAFMGAMLGIVMSGNLVQLVIFWELTSLFSFLLIGYWHHKAQARDGAHMALIVTATGGLCLLVGVILLGNIVGSFDLDVVVSAGDLVRNHDLYLPTLILILIGALTKSAQFPFFFWLPQAMSAPTPVSAYLHSATMVKAGIFLLILLWPVLSGTDAWLYMVGGAGLVTLIIGAYAAIFQHDLKGLLAYSTISHLGLITLLLGLETPLALVAAIFHTFNHATFKASLFMAVGVIDHETGTRDMRKLSGLLGYIPITGRLAMIATAAMAGVPLLNGFLSKEMFLNETLLHHGYSHFGSYALPVLATVASAFTVIYSLRFIHQTFFGAPPETLERIPHEPARWMRFPIEILVLVCLLVGIFPEKTIGSLLDMAVSSVLGAETPDYSLVVWHGLSPALIMSVSALTIGTIAYILLKSAINRNTKGPPFIHMIRGKQAYDIVIATLTLVTQQLQKLLGTRRLQPQLRYIIGTTITAGILTVMHHGLQPGIESQKITLLDASFAALWIIGCVCALGAAHQAKYNRVRALILLGSAGLVSSISFVWLSAPDLAKTQLLVEIVTTVMLLLGLRWLPKRDINIRTQRNLILSASRRTIDLSLAVCAGIGMSVVSYAIMTRPLANSISEYFVRNSYTGGGGLNVVNVILVDFRAFDTLGEITVLGIVGLTVYVLLRRFRPAAESLLKPEQQQRQNDYDFRREDMDKNGTLDDYTLVPRVIIKWLFPVIVLLAIFLFLRGHDLPGGGFTAGIVMAIAFILQYIAFGIRWIEARMSLLPLYWVGGGLLLALLTGAGAMVAGYPFLTSYYEYAYLPLLGKLPLPSAMLFDLGIFILVVGATMLTVIAIAHQSVRKPRIIDAENGDTDTDAAPPPEPGAPPSTQGAA